MGAFNQLLEFVEAVLNVVGNVGVYVVVVLYGVWRASQTFHHMRVVGRDAGINSGMSVLDESGIPNVGDAKFFE